MTKTARAAEQHRAVLAALQPYVLGQRGRADEGTLIWDAI
jgi:hypothetical protein